MANQKIKDLVDKGLNTQDLLNDRIDPLDGFAWWNGNQLFNNNWSVGFARTAVGDYSIATTGAATWRVLVGLTPTARILSAKGLKILDVAIHYTIGVAAATTVDVTIQKSVYSNGATPTVTNIPFTYDTAHDTNAERITVASHLLTATITAPEFQETDFTWFSAEFVVVLPGGGATLNVRGAGMHYAHDNL